MATYTNFAALLALGGGGGGDLDTVLASGNTTGGNNIIFSYSGAMDGSTDRISTEDNAGGAGYDFNLDGSDAGGGTNADGGDINLNPGAGDGSGVSGVVNINSDLVVTGDLVLAGGATLISGTGSPESSVTAGIGSVYQRTDGSLGNSLYVKQAGAGNTGWVPAGPMVIENQTASGMTDAFTTGRAVFDPSAVSEVSNVEVYWNGLLQRGGGEDYTIVYGGMSATITLSSTPPLNDFITIKYLPA